ncbi:hypothetical protein F5Y00DRAFT_225373 [Daldinia vernicosa]|uniref:uncharacterized protein n=1 Tax=Daldinia vernicosa TaxID=114800 RepID=UPI0020089A3D|nr:uncharacterized protein F5Y00DRAFT_225373 [Daldinia vernicosa]KAI0853080.1 hypothetical protein F5Y00DRAFT_225373 [Daldinia vernicosa]
MSSAHSDLCSAPESEYCQSTLDIGMATPTHTMSSTDRVEHSCSCLIHKIETKDTPPFPDQTFAIRERNTGRYITLIEGKLRVRENVGDQGGWHWICVESQGWLGFRSPVSGTYLGHDGNESIWAEYKHHDGQEFFCARKHPQGGYVLLTSHEDVLRKITVSNDFKLIETTGDGTLWDFVKVSA